MNSKALAMRAFLLLTGGVAAGFLCGGLAHADTHILVGGNTDCSSQVLLQTKIAQNDLQGDPVPISYGTCDGDFAPWVGSTPANVAIQQGVDATLQAWQDNCSAGQRCVIEGFSIGAAPVSIVGNQVGADQPGSNTHVITDGNAWGQLGAFGGPNPGPLGNAAKTGGPVFTGVPVDVPQVAGSENRVGVNDFWADDSGQNINGENEMASCIN